MPAPHRTMQRTSTSLTRLLSCSISSSSAASQASTTKVPFRARPSSVVYDVVADSPSLASDVRQLLTLSPASGESQCSVPFSQPFGQASEHATTATSGQGSSTRVSTLSNGVCVVSNETGSGVSGVTVALRGGLADQLPFERGAAALLGTSLLVGGGSSDARSALSLVRELEKIGGSIRANVSADTISVSGDATSNHADFVLENVVAALVGRTFKEHEIEWAKVLHEYTYDSASKYDTMGLLTQTVLEAAYHGQAHGNRLIVENDAVKQLSKDVLDSFLERIVVGSKLSIAASNFPGGHDAFVAAVQASPLGAVPAGTAPAPAQWIGGFRSMANPAGDNGNVHVGFGFKGPGVAENSKNAAVMAVLKRVLGGGGEFSSGGPGKGMQSRLFLDYVNKTREVDSLHAEVLPFADASVFMLLGSGHESLGFDLVARMREAVQGFSNITDDDVARARNLVEVDYLLSVADAQHASLAVEALNAADAEARVARPHAEVVAEIQSIQSKDVIDYATGLIDEPFAMGVVGNDNAVPGYLQTLSG